MTNIEIKVRALYDSLSNTERCVAEYFLENQDNIFNLPISRLAEETGVSQVAWVRFCKTIGFSGLRDFKRALFTELNETVADSEKNYNYDFTDVKDHSNVDQMIHTVTNSSIQALEQTAKLIASETVETIAQLIIDAKIVKLYGLGASGLVAEDFYHKLIRIGKPCCFCRDSHLQITYAANSRPNEVGILISNSGATRELVEILELCKKANSPTIAITKFGKSPLANGSTYQLYTSSPEVYRRSGAMSSRLAQMLAVDILFTAVAHQDYANIEPYLDNSSRILMPHKLDK